MTSVGTAKTEELTYTFNTPGALIYGCHVADQYARGMKGVVVTS